MNEFDNLAEGWDKDPMHWGRSEAMVIQIKKIISLTKEMSAMEYGAGTGIASFLLKDHLKNIVLMDNSVEMVKIMNKKIEDTKVKNMTALNFNLEHNEYKEGKFDLIFTQMVLHHIYDIENIISRFSKILNPGGYIAISDLYTEDGSFHGEGFDGHNGFDPDKLAVLLQKNKFSEILHSNCYTMDRKISETESRPFDIFLLTGKKD